MPARIAGSGAGPRRGVSSSRITSEIRDRAGRRSRRRWRKLIWKSSMRPGLKSLAADHGVVIPQRRFERRTGRLTQANYRLPVSLRLANIQVSRGAFAWGMDTAPGRLSRPSAAAARTRAPTIFEKRRELAYRRPDRRISPALPRRPGGGRGQGWQVPCGAEEVPRDRRHCRTRAGETAG